MKNAQNVNALKEIAFRVDPAQISNSLRRKWESLESGRKHPLA